MKMRRLLHFLSILVVFCALGEASAEDLRDKFALSAEGGVAFTPSGGFSYKKQVREAYEFGARVEYFFRSQLSAGLEVTHASFPGKRKTLPEYPFDQCRYYLSTEWNWTKVSLFGRFLVSPEKRFSPFFKGGLGLYIPRIEDWIFCPNLEYYYGEPCPFAGIEHTRETYGKGRLGYQLGFGFQYMAGTWLLFHTEMVFNVVRADGLVIRWLDYPPGIWHTHEMSQNAHYFSTLAGVSLLLDPGH